MRSLPSSVFSAAWLFTSVLCNENTSKPLERRQQLSDLLDKLGNLQPNLNLDIVKQITSAVGAGAVGGNGGLVTVIVDDVFGTKSQQTAVPSAPNQGAIIVTMSSQPGQTTNAPTSLAGGGSPVDNAPPQELTTTMRSTIMMTTTMTLDTATAIPSQDPATALQPVAPPAGAASSSLSSASSLSSSTTDVAQAAPTQPISGTFPAIVIKPTGAVVAQPNGPPTNAGALQPTGAAPLAASGGSLPPILLPTNAPAGVFPPGAPAAAPPAAVIPPSSSSSASSVQSGALAAGTGSVVNGQCACNCPCPTGAFPAQGAMPLQPLQPQLPPSASSQSVPTTLQTVILPPTSSISLPSSLLVDTSRPPPLPSSPLPVVAPPAQVTPSSPSLLPTSGLPVVAPPQKAIEPPVSTIQLGLGQTPPGPTPPPLPTEIPEINISTFSLVSSLVLALGV